MSFIYVNNTCQDFPRKPVIHIFESEKISLVSQKRSSGGRFLCIFNYNNPLLIYYTVVRNYSYMAEQVCFIIFLFNLSSFFQAAWNNFFSGVSAEVSYQKL